MLRAKTISIMVKKVEQTMMFQNMQAMGLKTPRPLSKECYTITSAIGLGGGQSPVIVKVYD